MNLFDDPNSMALLAAGASLLDAGGPSLTPQRFGPAAGKAINAYMSVLPQAKKQVANQQFQDYIAQNVGGDPSKVGMGQAGAGLFDVRRMMQDPQFMSLAMQSDQGGPFLQAALQQATQAPPKPSYDERDIQMPGGMMQKQVSRDGGQTWEPIGEPWDRRDPWKPFTSVGENGQIEIGYVNTKDGTRTTTGTKPDPARDKEGRAAWENVARAEDSFGRYRGLLERHGVELMPGADKLALSGAYQDLLLEMKELYNLGVLNGPDLEIMQKVLKDPTAASSAGYRGSTILNQLDTVVKPKLEAARRRAQRLYGEDPFAEGGDDIDALVERYAGG